MQDIIATMQVEHSEFIKRKEEKYHDEENIMMKDE